MLVPEELIVLAEPAPGSPRQLLDALLAPHGLAVSEGPGGTLRVVRGETPAPGEVRGRVQGTGGEHPPTARIVAGERRTVAAADPRGRFALSLPPGGYVLTVSAPGFLTREVGDVVVLPGAVTEVDVRLAPLEMVHETIRVSSDRGPDSAPLAEESLRLERETLDLAPSLVDDPYEVVDRLPGVSGSETSARLNVRGGRGDELLVLLDRLEVPNPYHVQGLGDGLISAFDVKTIGSVEYLGGAFPVQWRAAGDAPSPSA